MTGGYRSRMPTTHRFETVVRLPHTDAAGVVFYARYFDLIHLAFEDFLDAIGHPLRPDLHASSVGYPPVHAEADFKQSLRMGDRIAIDVAVGSVRARSFALEYVVSCRGVTVATAQTVHAAFDFPGKTRAALPEALRQALDERI